jgi:hypothetical protein
MVGLFDYLHPTTILDNPFAPPPWQRASSFSPLNVNGIHAAVGMHERTKTLIAVDSGRTVSIIKLWRTLSDRKLRKKRGGGGLDQWRSGRAISDLAHSGTFRSHGREFGLTMGGSSVHGLKGCI